MRSAGVDALHRARVPGGPDERIRHAMHSLLWLLNAAAHRSRYAATRSWDNRSMPREWYGKQVYLGAHQPTPEMDLTSCNTRIAPPPFVTMSTMKLPPLSRSTW